MPPQDRPARKKRRLRLTLGGLMVVVLVVGGGLGWLGHEARVQRAAVRAIEAAGGSVVYDWEWADGRPIPPGAISSWRKWLGRTIGPDYSGRVVYVDSWNTDDATLRYIGQLRRLKVLSLVREGITERGIAELRGLVHLKALSIHLCDIDSLDMLAGLENLEELDLAYTSIGDAAIDSIAGFPKLRELDLVDTKVTNAGLARLARTRKLSRLSLIETSIGDDGLRHLAAIPTLTILELDVTDVTDAGLVHLSKLKNLKSVTLEATRITNAGLPTLYALPSRPKLSLGNTAVTPEAIQAAEDARAKADAEGSPGATEPKP